MSETPPRPKRLAAYVLALVFEAILFGTAIPIGAWSPVTSDYRAFHTGGALVLEGKGARVSDLDAQVEIQARLFPEVPIDRDSLMAFVGTPFNALVFAPFAALGPFYGGLAWSTVVALALGALLADAQEALKRSPWRVRAALVVGLAFLPTIITVFRGQNGFFFALGLLNCRRALGRGDDLAAGLWLTLLAPKPTLVALPLLVLAFARRWRAVLGTLAGSAGWILVSVAVSGPGGLVRWVALLREVARWDGEHGVSPRWMINVRGVVATALGPASPAVVPLVALAFLAFAALLLAAFRGPWRPVGPRFDQRWALLSLALILSSPHHHGYDGVVFLVTGLLLAEAATADGASRLDRALGWFAVALAVVFVSWGWAPSSAGPGIAAFVLLWVPAVALAARAPDPPSGAPRDSTTVGPGAAGAASL